MNTFIFYMNLAMAQPLLTNEWTAIAFQSHYSEAVNVMQNQRNSSTAEL